MWGPNGRELFFLSREQLIMVSGYTVNAGGLAFGKPRVWSRKVLPRPAWANLFGFATPMFDVAPDGRRIAAVIAPNGVSDQKPVTHVTLLVNFFDYLRQRVPAGGK
jgi:hypothetical protein